MIWVEIFVTALWTFVSGTLAFYIGREVGRREAEQQVMQETVNAADEVFNR